MQTNDKEPKILVNTLEEWDRIEAEAKKKNPFSGAKYANLELS